MKIANARKEIIAILTLFICLAACKKDSDLILSPDQLPIGSYLRLDSTINTKLSDANAVSIRVSRVGEDIQKVTIYLSPTNSTDRNTWIKVKEVQMPSEQSLVLTVSKQEIETALGQPIANGATTRLFNEITTVSGKTFSIANIHSDTEASPDLKIALRWDATTPCAFDNSVFTGEFTVVTDTWQDYSPGAKVMVEPGPGANQVTIYAYPSDDYGTNRKGVILDVNPNTDPNTISVPEQIVGDYFAGGGALDKDVTMKGGGTINSCTKTIDITGIIFNFGGANYGTYKLTIKKI